MSPRRSARRGTRPRPVELTPAERRAAQSRFAGWLDEQLASTGWAVLGVTAAVPFAYTIGMAATLGAPELIALGLPAETATRLFNDIGGQIRAGRRFEPRELYDGILAGSYLVRFDPVDPSRYEDYVMQAITFHGHAEFPLWQLVWPDKQGRFPDDPRCDAGIRAGQALLREPRRPDGVGDAAGDDPRR
jgi:uncharacterized protein DUF4262